MKVSSVVTAKYISDKGFEKAVTLFREVKKGIRSQRDLHGVFNNKYKLDVYKLTCTEFNLGYIESDLKLLNITF